MGGVSSQIRPHPVPLREHPYPLSEGQAYAQAYAEWGFRYQLTSVRGESGRFAMNDVGAALPWQVIRQDDNGNRYRVGRYATRDEAQQIADSLDGRGHKQLY